MPPEHADHRLRRFSAPIGPYGGGLEPSSSSPNTTFHRHGIGVASTNIFASYAPGQEQQATPYPPQYQQTSSIETARTYPEPQWFSPTTTMYSRGNLEHRDMRGGTMARTVEDIWGAYDDRNHHPSYSQVLRSNAYDRRYDDFIPEGSGFGSQLIGTRSPTMGHASTSPKRWEGYQCQWYSEYAWNNRTPENNLRPSGGIGQNGFDHSTHALNVTNGTTPHSAGNTSQLPLFVSSQDGAPRIDYSFGERIAAGPPNNHRGGRCHKEDMYQDPCGPPYPDTEGLRARGGELDSSSHSSSRSNDSRIAQDPAICPICGKAFSGEYRKGNLARHRRQKHGGQEQSYPCEKSSCSQVFKRKDARLKHYRKQHPEFAPQPPHPRKFGSS